MISILLHLVARIRLDNSVSKFLWTENEISWEYFEATENQAKIRFVWRNQGTLQKDVLLLPFLADIFSIKIRIICENVVVQL